LYQADLGHRTNSWEGRKEKAKTVAALGAPAANFMVLKTNKGS